MSVGRFTLRFFSTSESSKAAISKRQGLSRAEYNNKLNALPTVVVWPNMVLHLTPAARAGIFLFAPLGLRRR